MRRGSGKGARSSRQMWEETFHRDKEEKVIARRRKADREKEGEEKEIPSPEPIHGVGDEAFWIPQRFGGILHVLKGNVYFTISTGGSGDQAAKIQKSKMLAAIVLKRL